MSGTVDIAARSTFYRVIDETTESHQTIIILSKRSKAVLNAEENWSAI